MKCPNPDCPFSQNEELKETCKFCFECGFNLRQDKKTTSAQNENTAPLSEDSKQAAAQCDDLHCNAKGSTDQADELQEKKLEEVDDKPSSVKSVEPSSGQCTLVADSTASPLANLALETKSGEQKKTEHCGFSGGNISSNLDPQEAAGYNNQDIADQQQKKKVEETEDEAAKEKSGETSSDQSTLLGSNANETKSKEQQQTENAGGQQKRNVEKTEDKPATEKSGEPSSGQSTPLADSTEIPLENRAFKMRSGEQQKTEQDQADEQPEKQLEEVDDKPASEESGEPSSGQSTLVADSTASPLENLAVETKSGEQMKTEHCGFPGGNISLNLDPQEAAGYNSQDIADQQQKKKVEETEDEAAKEKSGETSSDQSTLLGSNANETKSKEQQQTENADGQQKRNVEKIEDKPATEKSGEPSSGQCTLVADSTASPSENLALETKSGEQRKTEHCGFSGGNISSNLNPQEAAGYNSQDIADQQQKKKVEETEDEAAKEKSGETSSDQSTLLGSNANETKSKEQQQTENADGQQKRNVEKIEDKPATEKSGEPSSGQCTLVADSTASPSENLALETKSGEQRKTEHCGFSGGNISSNLNPQEAAGYNSQDDASKVIKAVLVKEDDSKASSHGIETNQGCDEEKISNDDNNENGTEVDSKIQVLEATEDVEPVMANNDHGSTSSESKDSEIRSRCNQYDDLVHSNDNADHEDEDEDEERRESDCKTDKIGLRKLFFFGKSRSKKGRQKKKNMKKRREEAQREAAREEKTEWSGVHDNREPHMRSKDEHVQRNQATCDHKQPEDNRGDNSHVVKGFRNDKNNEDNCKENAANSEFFWNDNGKKMTVIFHAVLAPHFKFEADQGDRIFMRFGPPFGNWKVDVVEVHPERMLENDFILVQAELLIPCTLLSEIVSYKYIVQKPNAKDAKETGQTLWEHMPGRGDRCNRCLQVPKERCKPKGDCHGKVSCCGCRNGTHSRPDLTFFALPEDRCRRRKWVVFCKQADKKFKNLLDPRIFSLHFEETDVKVSVSGR
ncbi:dentin sialophosphoprotein-like isoform X2 [Montipora foliosa]|uniref:dentin sialophosphoprotein-like isoform X2 n=1 Tax=Montipora foliosa TaxID=591990 RepID=UPI0035F1168A